jgi:hypothetical protein
METPFIYICSLMRTGSTFLQEAFTKPPHSLILSEPRFNGSIFRFNREMKQQIRAAGLDIPKGNNVRIIFEELSGGVAQLGVKEIRNHGWKGYLNAFENNIKVILIGRDPRDIYISAHGVKQRGNSWKPKFGLTPNGIYKELLGEVNVQKSLAPFDFTMKVRYEDLCTDFDNKYQEIKDFVGSTIPDVGEIGKFHKTIPAGKHEVDIHKCRITTKAVDRWKSEKNEKLLEEATIFFNLMVDYRELWGYK